MNDRLRTAPDHVSADGRRWLHTFDEAAFPRLHGVRLALCEADKHPRNPILPLGDLSQWDSGQASPWEGRTVLYDAEERLFKMWYGGTDASPGYWWKGGYAVSDDGITWEKPILGRVEYNGITRNNMFGEFYGPVIKDGAEPDPAHRYKMWVKGAPVGPPGARVIAYSADGMRWDEFHPLPAETAARQRGDAVLLLRDEQDPDPQRRYKMIWQAKVQAHKPGPPEVRAKFLACGPDERTWTASAANPILTPNDGREQENHMLMLIPYRGWYLMLHEYGFYVPNGYGVYGSYCGDIRLAVSRDGEHFRRLCPDQRILGRGRHGDWDDQFLVICDKAVVIDGVIHLYYSGQSQLWTSWPPKHNTPADMPYPRAGSIRPKRMGLATVGVDRLTCLRTADGETPGYAETLPLPARLVRDGSPRVNLTGAVPGRSWIEAEVLPADGDEPLLGYSRETCRPLVTDATAARVGWRPAADAAGVPMVRLRFWIYGAARLHAVSFAER